MGCSPLHAFAHAISIASIVATLGCRPPPRPSVGPSPVVSPTNAPSTGVAEPGPGSPMATRAPTAAVEPTGAPRGAMDKDDIRPVVRAALPNVKRCYNEGLARDPDLTGRVKYRFTIQPDGTVVAVSLVSSDLPRWASSVEDCIAAVVSGLTFPTPPIGGDVVVTYPFVLVPAQARWIPAAGQPDGTAVVDVRDGRNRPVEGATVTLVHRTPLRTQELGAVSDARGTALFSGLPAKGTVYAVVEGVYSDTAALDRSAIQVILHIADARSP
jgi:hypothetical protein